MRESYPCCEHCEPDPQSCWAAKIGHGCTCLECPPETQRAMTGGPGRMRVDQLTVRTQEAIKELKRALREEPHDFSGVQVTYDNLDADLSLLVAVDVRYLPNDRPKLRLVLEDQ